jgi:hypothetical protein
MNFSVVCRGGGRGIQGRSASAAAVQQKYIMKLQNKNKIK